MRTVPPPPPPPRQALDFSTFSNRVGAHHEHAGDTERAGALHVLPRSGSQRWNVLLAVARTGLRGLTDWEIVDALGSRSHTGVVARRNELVADHWLEDSGNRRDSDAGVPNKVWIVTADAFAILKRDGHV